MNKRKELHRLTSQFIISTKVIRNLFVGFMKFKPVNISLHRGLTHSEEFFIFCFRLSSGVFRIRLSHIP